MGGAFGKQCPIVGCPACALEYAGKGYPIDPIINKSGYMYTPKPGFGYAPAPAPYTTGYGYYRKGAEESTLFLSLAPA